MKSMTPFKLVGSICALVILGLGLFLGLILQITQAGAAGQSSGCSTSIGPVAPTPTLGTAISTVSTITTPNAAATATAISGAESSCYPGSAYATQVVSWAKKMADALYVLPSCGARRGGNCNDTWYTSAFPSEVLTYGHQWCQAHHDTTCADWANGTFQCVSFVRGAYSQVYPMRYSNDAFGLWATYAHLPGWQEIPAAATADLAQRFLPEPGDVMVFRDLSVGHVAIVLSVQPPENGQNGWITFANANSSSAYDRMPLLPSLLVDTREWAPSGEDYVVWGYIRPKLATAHPVMRVNQLDPAQYASQQEFQTWAYSACSAAAMTEVLNAYGFDLRIHDVLQVEARLQDITPDGGLQRDVGIAQTLAQFGMQTNWGEHWSLNQVLATANSGEPVIVSWPPDRYAGGHLVVVTGGDLTGGTIDLVDSSAWNRHTISVSQFLQWWAGFAAVATP